MTNKSVPSFLSLPLTTDEAIRRSLLKQRIATLADKRTDTNIPDSLGDQLVRMTLKLAWHFSHPDSDPLTPEIDQQARDLLEKAEIEQAQKMASSQPAIRKRKMS